MRASLSVFAASGADAMYADADWSAVLLAPPESLGVEDVTAAGVVLRVQVLRVQVRSTSADQWRVARELRLRPSERFAAEGIRTPAPVLAAPGAGVR